MKEGIYNKPLDTKIDLKNALAHVVHVEIGKSGKTDVNLMANVREGEFYLDGDVVSTLFIGAVVCLAWWVADRTIKWENEEDENNQD